MSDTETIVCLIVFLGFVGFLFLFFRLWRNTDLSAGPTPKSAKEAFALFRHASNWHQRLFVVFLCSPFLMRTGFGAVLISVATAGFASIAAICGNLDVSVLREVRQILLDFYAFVERLLRPASSHRGYRVRSCDIASLLCSHMRTPLARWVWDEVLRHPRCIVQEISVEQPAQSHPIATAMARHTARIFSPPRRPR